MNKPALIIVVFFLVLTSCNLFLNNQPDITVSYGGVPIQYSLDLTENKETNLSITAIDPDGKINSVSLSIDGTPVDITSFDADDSVDIFQGTYTLSNLSAGNVKSISVIVNDSSNNTAVKEFLLDTSALGEAGPDNPVEVVIPGIEIQDGGILFSPEPDGTVYYYNDLHEKEESDIQLDEPIFGTMNARRYLKVTGLAIPDDSGYTDRGYHSVLFTVENSSNRYYYTIPVNPSNRFRGFLYFPEAGTYTVMAYRSWNSYLYPHRGTETGVREGFSTLKFTVKVAEGDQVPAAYHYLLPTRNVDSGSKYVREYAAALTQGLSSDMDKVKALYKFLALGDENGEFSYKFYDEIYPGYLDNCWSDIFIASHFLANREGVCNDFSELFAAMTRSLGFKVQKVWGYIPGASGHQWNTILIDGTWYRLDATWACGSSNWKQYAEFYGEFDESYFTSSHEERYYSGYTMEY